MRVRGGIASMVTAAVCAAACGSSESSNTSGTGGAAATSGTGGASGGAGGGPDMIPVGAGGVPDTTAGAGGTAMQKNVLEWLLTEPLPPSGNPSGPPTIAAPSVKALRLERVAADGTIFTANGTDYNLINGDGTVRRHGMVVSTGNIYRTVTTASNTLVMMVNTTIEEMAQDGTFKWTLDCPGAIWGDLAIGADGSLAAVGLYKGAFSCGGLSLQAVGGEDTTFAMRLSSAGKVTWMTPISEPSASLNAVAIDGAGNVLAGGSEYVKSTMSWKAIALGYGQAAGDVLWQQDLAGEFVGQCVTTMSGDVACLHGTTALKSSDPSESHLTRFHGPDGTVAWTKMMPGYYDRTFLAPAPDDALLVTVGASIRVLDRTGAEGVATFAFTAGSAEAQLMPDGSVLCGGVIGQAVDFGNNSRIWIGSQSDARYLARLSPLSDLFAVGKVGL